MENKKYLLAVDSYDMAGSEDKNTQAFKYEENEFVQLKNHSETKVFNIVNYIGGGESLDYDLLQINRDTKIVIIESKIIDNVAIIDLRYSKDEIAEDDLTDAIETSYLKNCPYAKRKISLHDDLSSYNTLQELSERNQENNFAKQYLDDIPFLESFFRGEM